MVPIDKESRSVSGAVPKDYARPCLDKTCLRELIDLVSTSDLGDEPFRSKNLLVRVYEYSVARFATAGGKGGGKGGSSPTE